MNPDWDALLLAYLHDPPSKALDIRTHESRATALAQIALGDDITRQTLHGDTRTEDILASTVERVVPLPTAGEGYVRAVGPEAGTLQVFHPLSGHPRTLNVHPLTDSDNEESTLKALVANLDPVRARALAVWRWWRERLEKTNPTWGLLPAETRLPDHTIWHHTDAAMGCASSKNQHGLALLSFSLGPVQPFIAASRTVRDLWTGSYLLAYLTFAAMKPILAACGPAAILSPLLRGHPLLDQWLASLRFDESPGAPHLLSRLVGQIPNDQLLSPCLPNRFTAFVPLGRDQQTALDIAKQCETASRQAWSEVCKSVHNELTVQLRQKAVPHLDNWDRMWHDQVNSYFEFRTSVLSLNDCTDETLGRLLSDTGRLSDTLPDAFAVRELASLIPSADRPPQSSSPPRQWMAISDLLGRLSSAQRSVRDLPNYQATPDDQGRFPAKCSLLGTYEQMGPAERVASDDFWTKFAAAVPYRGSRVRSGEKLCAVSLVKRFAWPTFLSPQLKINQKELSYPDTATVAATLWLQQAEIYPHEHEDWSGQWLHWSSPGEDSEEDRIPDPLWRDIQEAKRIYGPPPAYYTIIMLDGDNMGKWLRGAMGPTVREVLHPRLVEYFQSLSGTSAALQARRPFGPTLSAAITEALSNFALHFVPAIVREHQGTLIYAGGDDVLALLPTIKALDCAKKLNDTFRQNWATDSTGRERLLMGQKATVSAGLAVVHYKEDLRAALAAARGAQKQAKDGLLGVDPADPKASKTSATPASASATPKGRNALCVRVVRRSGEDSSATIDWKSVPLLKELVQDFCDGASDRWAYRLRAQIPTLGELDRPLFEAELKRQLSRLEWNKPDRIEPFRQRVLALREHHFSRWPDSKTSREALVTLYQTASFLARGRDSR